MVFADRLGQRPFFFAERAHPLPEKSESLMNNGTWGGGGEGRGEVVALFFFCYVPTGLQAELGSQLVSLVTGVRTMRARRR